MNRIAILHRNPGLPSAHPMGILESNHDHPVTPMVLHNVTQRTRSAHSFSGWVDDTGNAVAQFAVETGRVIVGETTVVNVGYAA